jgi:hypothetical protein
MCVCVCVCVFVCVCQVDAMEDEHHPEGHEGAQRRFYDLGWEGCGAGGEEEGVHVHVHEWMRVWM